MHPNLPEKYGCDLAPIIEYVASSIHVPINLFFPHTYPVVVRQDCVGKSGTSVSGEHYFKI